MKAFEARSALPATFVDRLTCSVDPITLTGLALAGLAGGGAAAGLSALSGGGASATPAPTPVAPPASAPPAQSPSGKPGGGATAQPSFIGASAAPSSDFGTKTLVGQ